MKHVASSLLVAATALFLSVPASAQAHREAAARDAVARNRADAAASLELGRVLRRAGKLDAALTELRRGSTLANARAHAVPLARELAKVHLDQQQHAPALAACRKLATLPGGASLSHACAAEAHMLHKRASEAAPEIAKALALTPGLYEARVVQGYVRWQDGALAEAEQSFRDAASSAPQRTEAWLGLGRFLLATSRKPQAVEAFEKAVAADGDDPDALFALGANVTSSERATALLRQAVTGRPTFGAAHASLGEALSALGRLHEVEQEARAALQCTGVDPDWHSLLGEILLRRGMADEAMKSAEAALRLVSNHARAKLLQADAWSSRGDIDLAIEAWQVSFGLARTNPAPLVHGALGCLANNRPTTAKAFADRATQGFPQWGPGWEAAGDVAAKGGDKAAARSAWQRALTTDGPVDREAVRRKIALLDRK